MTIEDYIRDKYSVEDVLEKLSEHLFMQDVLDIIEEFDLQYIFEQELQEVNNQLELNF